MSVPTSDLWSTRGACQTDPATRVFHDPALDYDPDDPDYAHLTADGHRAAAAAKTAVERRAVAICRGCPLLSACDTWARTHAVHGVVGGRTEDERRALRTPDLDGHGVSPHTPGPADTPPSLPIDRGPRHQVNDLIVARLTAEGRDTTFIAREMRCSERSVTRSRARLRRTGHTVPTATPRRPAETPTGIPVRVPARVPARIGRRTDPFTGVLASRTSVA